MQELPVWVLVHYQLHYLTILHERHMTVDNLSLKEVTDIPAKRKSRSRADDLNRIAKISTKIGIYLFLSILICI
jgi:hypothetical protein